ncbi:DUF6289 family protein [Nonomuraea sp. NPDC051191]|uniref:DUF6289 family protein n=1 Tax=Nonomuraea sp. NPDC051191 TaxID=3364372 RepID=UPI00379829AD
MIRRVLAVAVLAAATLAVIPAAAQAVPACPVGYLCNTQYFSDSARTNLVGVRTEFCDRSVSTWGRLSGYITWSSSPCND